MAGKRMSAEAVNALRLCASKDLDIAMKAQKALAQSLEIPLRKAIFEGDTLAGIYTDHYLEPGAQANFPLFFVAPGEQADYIAFTMPRQGRIPERHIEGDEVWVQTYKIANAIDWDLSYARDARWDVIEGATEVLRAGFTKRMNDDGWHVLLACGLAGALMTQDTAAASGYFTKRLINRMKTVQKRRTLDGKLTDMYISAEGLEDIRDWDESEIDALTRREIFMSEDGIIRMYGVNLHELLGLGVSQEYQTYFVTTLSGSLGSGDEELVIGLDLSKKDAFVRPIREELVLFEDASLHRQGRAGIYGWSTLGYSCLDSRRVLCGSF